MVAIHRPVIFTLVLCLAGCMTSLASPDAPATQTAETTEQATPRDGTTRIAAAGTPEGASCLKTCGLEARKGTYTECLSSGSAKDECRTTARTWYLDCIQSQCSAEEVQLDTCRTECRTAGSAARDACGADAATAETCTTAARETTRTCVASCRAPAE